MNKHFEKPTRFHAAGLATGLILALIVAMAISLIFDVQPAEASAVNKVAQKAAVAHA